MVKARREATAFAAVEIELNARRSENQAEGRFSRPPGKVV
ncbi:hypothetical protein Msil_2524 [Methylocella silvestris BL2]|uniref:Uncharacterized protein n=1 Tax=Methylocella silvestris (strain DSM 15510 / CIP 108128 / LMG 27833 / NCIMB 13906 / BL2) TaxID=395965 RepID=B8EM59_METSB|nr:hypothetical protein Msil_2524 [Methylocella silvestris BL2]